MAEKGFAKKKDGQISKEEMEELARQDTAIARAKTALQEKDSSDVYPDEFTEGPEEESEEVEDEESPESPEKTIKPEKVSKEPKIDEETAKAIFAEGQKAGYRQAKRELLDWVIG